MKLYHPRYVTAVLLHRAFVDMENYEYHHKFKFVPFFNPVLSTYECPRFIIKEGILQGYIFECSIEHQKTINADIISEKIKVKSRIAVYNETSGS